MGKRIEEKRKTDIQRKMDRLILIEEICKTKLKIAKKCGKKQGISMKSKNIGEIARRKLEEDIIPQFRDAGIDFFGNSIITRVIIDQIITYSRNGEKFLDEYNRTLMPEQANTPKKEQTDTPGKSQVQLARANAFSKTLARIRKFFARSEKLGATQIEHAKQNINLYDEESRKVENYNWRENIVDMIVNSLCPDNGLMQLAYSVPNIVNRQIAPQLNQLGLGDLIPQLKQQLVAKYETVEEVHYGDPAEIRQMYIPNFVEDKGIATEQEEASADEVEQGDI